MIDKSLETLKKVIHNYLVLLPELNLTSEEAIVLTSVVKPDGAMAIPENSLGITLVRVEEERVVKSQNSVSINSEGMVSKINPEIKLNLFVLVSANFSNYETGLKFLSAVVKCFQGNNVFTPGNTPEMDPSLQKLIVELYTLNFEEQNHLWGSLGAKYIPSLLYRVRLITVQEAQKLKEEPQIKKVEYSERST